VRSKDSTCGRLIYVAPVGAALVLLLLAPGARAAESGPYGACDDDGKCRRFKTEGEFKRYQDVYAAERAAMRRKALRVLPVNEMDCGMPVLIDLMESSGAVKEKDTQLYVTLGEGDINALHREELARQGIHVLAGSASRRRTEDNQRTDPRHTKRWGFSVMLLSVGSVPETFDMGAGYACGSLCMGRLHYTVRVAGKRCTIVSKQLLAVS